MAPSQNNSRSSHLDVAKGIAIIAVTYGHAAVLMMGYPIYGQQLGVQNIIIFSLVMPIFFLISGAFQRVRLDAPHFNAKTYLGKITTSLLIPFYALCFFFMVPNLILGARVYAPSLQQMLFAMFVQQTNGTYLPSVVLWFLFVLFVFHLLSFLAVKVLRVNVIVLILIAMLLRPRYPAIENWILFGFDKLCDYFLFYLLGFAFYKRVIDKPISSPQALLALAAVYLGALFFEVNRPDGLVVALLKPFGIFELSFCLLTIGISYSLTTQFRDHPVVKSLAYFGAYSILVYVFHMPTMTIVKAIALRLGVTPDYSLLVFMFIPGLLVPLLAGKLLATNRPVYKTLLGRNP
jgi:fucose 4-O-acetylase-like acetyltransferase